MARAKCLFVLERMIVAMEGGQEGRFSGAASCGNMSDKINGLAKVTQTRLPARHNSDGTQRLSVEYCRVNEVFIDYLAEATAVLADVEINLMFIPAMYILFVITQYKCQ